MHEETKIEMKLEEETKPIKKVCEKVMDIVSTEFEKGVENVDTKEMGEAIDILKDLYEAKEKIVKACYYKYILAAMEKEETDEEETKKIMEKMREEYGSEDEDMERRFYDNYRYKRTGRFAPKGRGSYVGRRGYEEPPYYRMSPEMYKEHDPSYWRDVDREQLGRMYFPNDGGGSDMGGSRSGGSGGSMGGNSGNMGGGSSSRGYSDGYSDGMNEGTRRGYEDGYRDGESRGRNSQGRDSREGRSGRSRRTYMETKEMNKDNSAESKQKKMKELEAYMAELSGDITEMINDASPEERSLLKQKLQVLTQKVN